MLCWFFFGSSVFMSLLLFVPMSLMITVLWSLMANAGSWSPVPFITLVALQRSAYTYIYIAPTTEYDTEWHMWLHLITSMSKCRCHVLCLCRCFISSYFVFSLKFLLFDNGSICYCRCGQILFRKRKMEDLMWLRLMFSGTYTNQYEARFSSLHLSFHFHNTIALHCVNFQWLMDYMLWLAV